MTTLIQAIQYTLGSDQKWTVGTKPNFTIDSKAAAPTAVEPATLTVETASTTADGKAADPTSTVAPASSAAATDSKSAPIAAAPAVTNDSKKTAEQLEEIAETILAADYRKLNEAGLQLNGKTLTDGNYLAVNALKAQPWLNAAKQYEEEKKSVEAIRCYRNALFQLNAVTLKTPIFKEMKRLEQQAITAERERASYLINSVNAYKSDSKQPSSRGFAEALIHLAHDKSISAAKIIEFLNTDINKKIIPAEQRDLICNGFLIVLVPEAAELNNNDGTRTENTHLLDSLRKYGANFTLDFLDVSNHHDKLLVLVRTYFQKDFIKDEKLQGEFKKAIATTFTKSEDKTAIAQEVKNQFNTLAKAQIHEYRANALRDKVKRGLKANAIEAINKALNPSDNSETNFAAVLTIIATHQKDVAVVMEGRSAKTANLINGLALALTSLGFTAKPVADEKAAATNGKSVTASAVVADTATASTVTDAKAAPAASASPFDNSSTTATTSAAAGSTTSEAPDTKSAAIAAPAEANAFGTANNTALPASKAGTAAAGSSTPSKTAPAAVSLLSSPGATAVPPLPIPVAGTAAAAQSNANAKPPSAPTPTPG